MPRLARLWRAGEASTVDLLGEKTLTAAEADAYAARVDGFSRRSWTRPLHGRTIPRSNAIRGEPCRVRTSR